MLRILHTEASLELGGQELRIVKKLDALQKKGYWVYLVANRKSGIYKLAKEYNIQLLDLNLSSRKISTFLKLKNFVLKQNIDIVHTHSSRDSWYGVLLKLLNPKIKLVRTRHISTPISCNIFSNFLYKMPDLIITTGESIKSNMVKNNKISPKKILSLPTGVDLSKFDRNNCVPAFQEEKFSIATISILRSWKGHLILFQALKRLLKRHPEILCIIVGDGPQKENLKHQVKEMHLERHIKFLGYREDIPNILASIDALVHPSIAHEGMPQVILQALAMEVPVIATDVGSISEVIINNETGFLIPPKDTYHLEHCIEYIYNNRKLAQKMAQKGRKLIEKEYSFDKMIKKLENAYKKLAANP